MIIISRHNSKKCIIIVAFYGHTVSLASSSVLTSLVKLVDSIGTLISRWHLITTTRYSWPRSCFLIEIFQSCWASKNSDPNSKLAKEKKLEDFSKMTSSCNCLIGPGTRLVIRYLAVCCNILYRMIKPGLSETQAEAETKRKNEHYDWFILLLVLPTVSIWLKS